MHYYIVQYEGRNIKIEVEDKEHVIPVTCAKLRAKGVTIPLDTTFYILECYDQLLQSYYEVEPEDMPSSGVLKLRLQGQPDNSMR